VEIKGIDVSRYQGNIDWQRVKNAGVQFAILRCGTGYSGGTKDSKFELNYTAAKKVGLPVGAYFYSYAKTVEDARNEAKLVLTWISGKQFEYPIVFDIEDKTQSTLSKATISNIIRAFAEKLESSGYFVTIYANKDWLEKRIDEDCKTRYDIWLAQWSKKPTYKGNFGMWQYTSSGKVDGISGNVDMDIAYKDYPTIIKKKNCNGYFVAKNEVDKIVEKMKQPAVKTFKKGQMVNLKYTPLYASATTNKVSGYRSGAFYVYDGEQVDGRYRVTNKQKNCGRKPAGVFVTGWVKLQ
jgi:GH25 family lysozyme M1 (1,4-beta-N-acetylmuramidase)